MLKTPYKAGKNWTSLHLEIPAALVVLWNYDKVKLGDEMKKLFFAFLIVLSVTFTILAESSTNTVQSCIELLPDGREYKLSLQTSIDTKESGDELIWDIKMDDGRGEESDIVDDQMDKEIEPFIECLIPLLQ